MIPPPAFRTYRDHPGPRRKVSPMKRKKPPTFRKTAFWP